MSGITVFEFDALVAEAPAPTAADDSQPIPASAFAWLEQQALGAAEGENVPWLRLTQRRRQHAIQVMSFVGVIRTPDGFQIEVLPKIGKAAGEPAQVRQLLIDMLQSLDGFRHVQTERAQLAAVRMPLLEVFVDEFLRTVEFVVKHGLRSDYSAQQVNLFALRGKLLLAAHLRRNVCRGDRFFTEHDEFITDRPENRLLHAALRRVLQISASQHNQQRGRELAFVFADVPVSTVPKLDFQRTRLDRNMSSYADALAWARLILDEDSPLTGIGRHRAPSLLFPMEAVFEAFVAKHLARQLSRPLVLKTQASSYHLVVHKGQNWFRLKPDLLIRDDERYRLVLDSKWKLLDSSRSNATEKYGLSQGDLYQLQSYGLTYLDGKGDVVLIFPRTSSFNEPLPVFEFPKSKGLRLWVLPFCLETRRLLLPNDAPFCNAFNDGAQ